MYNFQNSVPLHSLHCLRVYGRSLAGIVISNPTGVSVSYVCWVLSARGLSVGLITRPEESYWVWCVWAWSWSLDNDEALAHWGLSLRGMLMVNVLMCTLYQFHFQCCYTN